MRVDKEKGLRYQRNWYKKRRKEQPLYWLIKSARQRAKNQGLEFSITLSDLVIPIYCPVFGFKLKSGKDKSVYNSYSIDRKDSTKGYTPDNVQVISFRANTCKNLMAASDVERLLTFMRTQDAMERLKLPKK